MRHTAWFHVTARAIRGGVARFGYDATRRAGAATGSDSPVRHPIEDWDTLHSSALCRPSPMLNGQPPNWPWEALKLMSPAAAPESVYGHTFLGRGGHQTPACTSLTSTDRREPSGCTLQILPTRGATVGRSVRRMGFGGRWTPASRPRRLPTFTPCGSNAARSATLEEGDGTVCHGNRLGLGRRCGAPVRCLCTAVVVLTSESPIDEPACGPRRGLVGDFHPRSQGDSNPGRI